ncbi:hypothetical protein SASPL_129658 [Salvia splendens]|uniref:Uncharacterized protein n=1 Tax=Salvia splendens TaxID=180675 RepID=A0A8X8XG68_SALSN|nr:hypothetical protein SASPL_129658 [Salvia splendens]
MAVVNLVEDYFESTAATESNHFEFNTSGREVEEPLDVPNVTCDGYDGSDGSDNCDGSDGSDNCDGADNVDGADGSDCDGSDGSQPSDLDYSAESCEDSTDDETLDMMVENYVPPSVRGEQPVYLYSILENLTQMSENIRVCIGKREISWWFSSISSTHHYIISTCRKKLKKGNKTRKALSDLGLLFDNSISAEFLDKASSQLPSVSRISHCINLFHACCSSFKHYCQVIRILQVAEARETLLKQLQSKNAQETSGNPDSSDAKYASSETVNPTQPRETVDEPESESVSVSVSGHQPEAVEPGPSADAHKQSPNEEDVSFSDLEDEENDDPSDKLSARRASTSEKAWVQLDENSGSQGSKPNASHNVSKDKESEGEDSNDWLTVDDTDFDNLGAV